MSPTQRGEPVKNEAGAEAERKGTLRTDGTVSNSREHAFARAGRGLRSEHPDRHDPQHRQQQREEPK